MFITRFGTNLSASYNPESWSTHDLSAEQAVKFSAMYVSVHSPSAAGSGTLLQIYAEVIAELLAGRTNMCSVNLRTLY